MDAIGDKNKKSAVPEYAAVDQLNKNDIQIYSDINLKSESDGSGPAAKSTKCRVRYALAAAALIAGVAFLTMFVVVIVILALRDVPQAMNNGNMSNTQTYNDRLDSLNKRIDFLNASNVLNSSAYYNDLYGVTPGYPRLQSSCAGILERNSSSTSGYYFVRSLSGQLRSVYCDMRRTCSNITGGWMRVAMLDVQNCPPELKQKIFNGNITTYVVREDDRGCTSIFYSSLDIPYSKACGRIGAYQIGTPDGFLRMQDEQACSSCLALYRSIYNTFIYCAE